MNLTHLPTLDGSVEASVARLDALAALHDIAEIEDGVWQAGVIVDSIVGDLVSPDRRCQEKASVLRAEHEAVLTHVQHEIDRLVSA